MTIHFAGLDTQVGPLLRQRCAWCGTVLVDYDLARTASPCAEACATTGCRPEYHRPATWPPGALIHVTGVSPRLTTQVPHEDGQQLPTGTCLDVKATTPSTSDTSDTTAHMALGLLDSTITTAYTALRDLGLGPAPARDALLGQVADTIAVVAGEIDGVPTDEDDSEATR